MVKAIPLKEVPKQRTSVLPDKGRNPKMLWPFISIPLILTIIAYLPSFQSGFVTWDDPDYVINNQMIRSFSNLHALLFTPLQGNYHPLTMLSLALNYAISGQDAGSYHALNVLLHLMNVILVFFFVYRLTEKKIWIAFITALLFGIHPLHVESVAWVSERKDVLYTFFFLSGLMAYLKYLEAKSIIKIVPVFIFFILSLLSKPAAVIFPFVLMTIDYAIRRGSSIRIWVEKIPFLGLSLVMGILTLQAQTIQGSVSYIQNFPLSFKFTFGFYGLMMYILKTVLPIHLCAMYQYPPLNESLPLPYYISLIFGLGLILIFIRTFRKNRLIAFSLMFYVLNLMLVLQFFPVGSAVMADRYTYVPLIGIFLIIGYGFQEWVSRHGGKPPMVGLVAVAIVSICLTYMSNKQTNTWKSNVALWDRVIEIEPGSEAYSHRALAFKQEGNINAALELFNKAIPMNKLATIALMNRGTIYFQLGKDSLAFADYRSSLALNQNNSTLLVNIANLFGRQGAYDSCLYYVNKSMKIDSSNKDNYRTRSMCFEHMQKYEEAISDLKHLISIDSSGEVMNEIGANYQFLKNYNESIIWLNKAIAQNPKSAQFYFNRSQSYFYSRDKQNALLDVDRARQLGMAIPESYFSLLK